MGAPAEYDVAVAGLGAMGSMAALELARRGRRVVGFDRNHPPHSLGSSHGKSRIIREAYFEHPQYVPIVRRAYELWAGLERASGRRLLIPTGGLMIGPPDGVVVSGARRSAETHGLPFEVFTPEQARRRWPMFALRRGEVALHEPRAGVLLPEAAVEAALELAAAAGAELRFDEPVEGWEAGAAVSLSTVRGETRAGRLILAAGAWMATGLPQLELPLSVARQPLFWFDAEGELGPDSMPVFIWEWEPGRCIYGFPDLGDGVKVAIHHGGRTTDPDGVARRVEKGEADELLDVLEDCAPALAGPVADSAVCLYTNTPDGDFILDAHPADARVLIASPCSGHGFKFAPAIGEIMADLAESRSPRFDLTPFRLSRTPRGEW